MKWNIHVYRWAGWKAGAGVINNITCKSSSMATTMCICVFWVQLGTRRSEWKNYSTYIQGKASTYIILLLIMPITIKYKLLFYGLKNRLSRSSWIILGTGNHQVAMTKSRPNKLLPSGPSISPSLIYIINLQSCEIFHFVQPLPFSFYMFKSCHSWYLWSGRRSS